MDKRARMAVVVSLLVFFSCCAYMLYDFSRVVRVKDQRVVQILKSVDGKHEAQLT